uniref:Uncharacterized protein n=1 Tax=Haemonchus contortus TaxID=6289 RepID=A0A7I4YUP6_HAECO
MLARGDALSDTSKEALSKSCTPVEMKEEEPYRALPVRIKSMYNCEEQRVVPMAPPFRGFSALVRFQCRARIHNVEKINVKGRISTRNHRKQKSPIRTAGAINESILVTNT